jgi:hypothetical protein
MSTRPSPLRSAFRPSITGTFHPFAHGCVVAPLPGTLSRWAQRLYVAASSVLFPQRSSWQSLLLIARTWFVHGLVTIITDWLELAKPSYFPSCFMIQLRTPGGADYLTPPPAWAPLRGHAVNPDVRTNLMDGFVAMDAESDSYGMVYDLAGFVSWCAGDNEMA